MSECTHDCSTCGKDCADRTAESFRKNRPAVKASRCACARAKLKTDRTQTGDS